MKYLLSFSLLFISLPSFASYCVLSVGNIDEHHGSSGEFQVVDRADNMINQKEYYLTSLKDGVVILVSTNNQGSDTATFRLSTENRVYHWPKGTFSQGVEVAQTGYLKVSGIEQDYEVTCYAH